MESKREIGLFQLQELIRKSLENSFREEIWVRGEISEIKNNPAGHCYITLVEKDEAGNGLTAKASAIIWASSYRIIKPYFETSTGTSLSSGMNILVKVQIQYSELYGLSLIVRDIDPAFTMGELEIARQKTIVRLKQEGMFDMNSTLSLPLLPKRFAVISSEQAAGYRDFMRHLHENEYGFYFETTLFPAPVQGKDAPEGIIAALDEIAGAIDKYDAVLILRGGGGAMDLICFDDYALAVNVAQFPIPVITGVGHDHDYHVVDMVAHTNLKTPTAVADFFIDMTAQEDYRVTSVISRLKMALDRKLQAGMASIDQYRIRMANALELKLLKEEQKVQLLEYKVNAANPQEILSKGFSIVIKDGRRIDTISKINKDDEISLMLGDGIAECLVLTKHK